MRSPSRGLIEHDARLDILCCLDGQAWTEAAVSACAGLPIDVTRHFLLLLHSCGAIKKTGGRGGGELLYEGCLDELPAWAQDAVEAHRRRREE
jgi:hypothetical protein